jgi:beta-galactosidase GanA
VNEFDWSVLELTEGEYNFTLLDRAIELFVKYDLKAIDGTPTATPPNWLTENYDIDFVDRTTPRCCLALVDTTVSLLSTVVNRVRRSLAN